MLDVLFLMSMIICITGNPSDNLALHKPTCISSVYDLYNSSYAVDGNTGANIYSDVCAHTDVNDTTPWLMIDLQGTYLVNNVVLTNRGDCCWERLHSFVIEIFEKNPQRCAGAITGVCVNYTGESPGQGETRTFACETPVRGRFVRIRKWKVNNRHDALALCEVQIFGSIPAGCGFSYTIKRINGIRVRSEHVELTTITSPVECGKKCVRKTSCLSFNFNANTKECELLFKPMFNDTIDILPVWSYYGSDIC